MVRPARVRTAAALTDLATGATARAEVGFTAAEALFAGTGQCLEIVYARHNRALVAFARGDLPGALRHLDDAAARYAELGVTVPDATLDRCAVLLAAAKRAELLLAAARTALAAGHYKPSAERAELSRQMFRVQHRERWRAHAALVVLQGRFWPAGTAVAMPFDVSALLDAQGAREVDFARFGLSRIARGRLAEPAGQALAVAGRPGGERAEVGTLAAEYGRATVLAVVTRPRPGCPPRSTVPAWRTSPRTGCSGPTARCSAQL